MVGGSSPARSPPNGGLHRHSLHRRQGQSPESRSHSTHLLADLPIIRWQLPQQQKFRGATSQRCRGRGLSLNPLHPRSSAEMFPLESIISVPASPVWLRFGGFGPIVLWHRTATLVPSRPGWPGWEHGTRPQSGRGAGSYQFVCGGRYLGFGRGTFAPVCWRNWSIKVAKFLQLVGSRGREILGLASDQWARSRATPRTIVFVEVDQLPISDPDNAEWPEVAPVMGEMPKRAVGGFHLAGTKK